jgi:hypothetical protein
VLRVKIAWGGHAQRDIRYISYLNSGIISLKEFYSFAPSFDSRYVPPSARKSKSKVVRLHQRTLRLGSDEFST